MHISGRRIAPGQTGHEAAWLLLEEMYRQHIGGPMPAVSRTDRGKPYFAPQTCHFSITHTKKHVFCVLSDRPVGIDGEEMDREVHPKLAEKILSATEKPRYLAASHRPTALLKLWVLKEAWVKCTGEGLQGYPKDTDFSPDDPRLMEIDGCFVAVIEEEDYAV